MSEQPKHDEPPEGWGMFNAKQIYASLNQETRDALALLAGDEARKRLAAWEAFRQQVRRWYDDEEMVPLQRRQLSAVLTMMPPASPQSRSGERT